MLKSSDTKPLSLCILTNIVSNGTGKKKGMQKWHNVTWKTCLLYKTISNILNFNEQGHTGYNISTKTEYYYHYYYFIMVSHNKLQLIELFLSGKSFKLVAIAFLMTFMWKPQILHKIRLHTVLFQRTRTVIRQKYDVIM